MTGGDRIRLEGLRAFGFHGVLPAERESGQDFVVDTELEFDVSAAAASDQLADTVDYAALAGALHAVVTGPAADLIETLALRLVAVALADPRVAAATVTVHKPQAPVGLPFADVAVRVRRVAAVLSLGSNLGDRLGHLQAGLDCLRTQLPVLAVSPVYQTAPAGGPEQGPYLNAVVRVAATDGGAALAAAHLAEQARGRTRGVRFGPRTLDVDVVAAAGQTSTDPGLILPHPRARERAFVLAPWVDVEPAAVLGDQPVADLLEQRLAAGDEVAAVPGLVLR